MIIVQTWRKLQYLYLIGEVLYFLVELRASMNQRQLYIIVSILEKLRPSIPSGVWATAKKAAITVGTYTDPNNCFYLEGTASCGMINDEGQPVEDETSGIVCKAANAMKESTVLDST